MDKPDVDFIEGLSPAISIDQKSASRNPRSTVGTITEIYDYLRLLYARIGIPHCPKCGRVITRQTPQQIVDRVLQLPEGTRFQVLAPVVRGRKGEYEGLLTELSKQGFTRARIDGEVVELSDRATDRLARYENHTIEIVVDRLVRRSGIERRLTDSLETALRLAEGVAEVEIVPKDGEEGVEPETLTFSEHLACTHDGLSFDELAPRNFSFNSPYGACERCDGLGTRFEVDPELIVGDDDLSIRDGALTPWSGYRGDYFNRVLDAVGDEYGFSVDTPWKRLTKAQRKVVLYGAGKTQVLVRYKNRYGRKREYKTRYEGVIPWLERRYTEADSDRSREQIEGYMREVPCTACDGARLRPASLGVTIAGQNISEVGNLSIRKTAEFFAGRRAQRARAAHRGAGAQGGQRAAALPARRRPRLPEPQPQRGHARRRRGAAHPAREPDRQRPRRRAVRARRAVDRAPPAGQPAPDRHDDPAAGPRQHRARRRARRGDDPGRGPHRGHRSGRG